MRYYSPEYLAYMQSEAWRAKRDEALEAAQHRCANCDMPGPPVVLQVHHLTYERLGHERRAEARRCGTMADLHAWARTVFGNDWQQLVDLGWLHSIAGHDQAPKVKVVGGSGPGVQPGRRFDKPPG